MYQCPIVKAASLFPKSFHYVSTEVCLLPFKTGQKMRNRGNSLGTKFRSTPSTGYKEEQLALNRETVFGKCPHSLKRSIYVSTESVGKMKSFPRLRRCVLFLGERVN